MHYETAHREHVPLKSVYISKQENSGLAMDNQPALPLSPPQIHLIRALRLGPSLHPKRVPAAMGPRP